MPWLDDPIALLTALPPLVLPLFVLGSAALEYVVPPFWGDLFVLLGFVLAGQGASSLWLVFLAAFVGSLCGAAIAFFLGRRYGMALARRMALGPRDGSRRRVRRLLERFGERVLVANRFVPVVRGLMLYGAGAFRLRPESALFYTALSNVAWLTLLMGTGVATAGSWDEIAATFRRTSALSGGVVAALVVAWAGVTLWRMRRVAGPLGEASSR